MSDFRSTKDYFFGFVFINDKFVYKSLLLLVCTRSRWSCIIACCVLCRNTLSQALDSMKRETDKIAEVHADLSSRLSSAAQRMSEFITRQKAEIKLVKTVMLNSLVTRISIYQSVSWHSRCCRL